jgi:hypothetical protein
MLSGARRLAPAKKLARSRISTAGRSGCCFAPPPYSSGRTLQQPISLSDSELTIVMRAAAPLHPIERVAFLNAIATRLRSEPVLGDGLISRVARELLREMRRAPRLDAAEEQRAAAANGRRGMGKYR